MSTLEYKTIIEPAEPFAPSSMAGLVRRTSGRRGSTYIGTLGGTRTSFKFIRPGKLVDGDLELVLASVEKGDPVRRHVPMYEFEMVHASRKMTMGKIRLRIGSARTLRYPGHIGYEVRPRFRGHRYAARSCQLLLALANAHGLKVVWLTVDPRNIASQKTCRIIGARYIETVRIPPSHEMYQDGARYRRRYRLALAKMPSNAKSKGSHQGKL